MCYSISRFTDVRARSDREPRGAARAGRCQSEVTIPTTSDITRITTYGDVVIRNLLITQSYHELALAARRHIGTGANWCAFATWASKQAGRTIRREDVRTALRARLEATPELHSLIITTLAATRGLGAVRSASALLDELVRALDVDGVFTRASRAVAEGNLRVFEEIALQFARFLEAIASDDADAITRFLDGLQPGDPPTGQKMLRDAFAAYSAAIVESDATARAQLMFYGNLLIGLHEQRRLQPQIVAALNASFDEAAVRQRLLETLLPGRWRTLRYQLAALLGRRPPLDEIIDAVIPLVQRELRRVLTAHVMTLHLPWDVVIRLGEDVAGTHAESLATISEPRLAELLRRIDPIPGSGAADWSELSERMHLIAELFRCRHDWEPLFEPPFTPPQLAELRAGRRPPDPL
jgi:hypothetical protein